MSGNCTNEEILPEVAASGGSASGEDAPIVDRATGRGGYLVTI